MHWPPAPCTRLLREIRQSEPSTNSSVVDLLRQWKNISPASGTRNEFGATITATATACPLASSCIHWGRFSSSIERMHQCGLPMAKDSSAIRSGKQA